MGGLYEDLRESLGKGLDLLTVEALEQHNIDERAGENLWLIPIMQNGEARGIIALGNKAGGYSGRYVLISPAQVKLSGFTAH